MDIGPTSVRLEWTFGDNGGAPITYISVAAVTLGQDTDFQDMAIESGQTSALISGLKDSHQYVLRLRAKNRIGKLQVFIVVAEYTATSHSSPRHFSDFTATTLVHAKMTTANN